jgi:uncharacterized membrane protein
MKENFELRALARDRLKGNWGEAVGLMLIYSILFGVSGAVFGIGELIVGGPLMFGVVGYFLHKVRGEEAMIENLFDGFKIFVPTMLLFLLQAVFIALWTMLLIIPGIVKTLSYSMAFFIMRDNPGMGASEAITASRKMMNGYKTKLFMLQLSFIGWILLCLLTFGLGYVVLGPYMMMTLANFYDDLKKQPRAELTA